MPKIKGRTMKVRGTIKEGEKTKAVPVKAGGTIAKPNTVRQPVPSRPKQTAGPKVKQTVGSPAKVTQPMPSKPKTISSKPLKSVKTRGGDYPVYAKKSSEAKSFRSAFAAARKAGKKVFTWQGRKYTTKVK